MAGAALGAIPLAVRAIDRKWPAWQTLAVGGAGVMALLCPLLVHAWPWWTPFVGGLVGGGLGFLAASVALVGHHRRLWSQFLYALELRARRDLTGDGVIGQPTTAKPAPVRAMYVQPVGEAPQLDAGQEEPEQNPYDDEADEADRLDFGQFVDGIWPAPGRYNRGTSYRDWRGIVLASGRRLSEDRWREYMQRLLRCNLVRRRDASINVPYDVIADRATALRAVAEAIILPAGAGQQELEIPIGQQ